jgi:hypothetical protein
MDKLVFGMQFEDFNVLADAFLAGGLSNEKFNSLPAETQRELIAERNAMAIASIDGAPLDPYLRRLTRLANFGFISEDKWIQQGLEYIRKA